MFPIVSYPIQYFPVRLNIIVGLILFPHQFIRIYILQELHSVNIHRSNRIGVLNVELQHPFNKFHVIYSH